jgi:hypothetical protein
MHERRALSLVLTTRRFMCRMSELTLRKDMPVKLTGNRLLLVGLVALCSMIEAPATAVSLHWGYMAQRGHV